MDHPGFVICLDPVQSRSRIEELVTSFRVITIEAPRCRLRNDITPEGALPEGPRIPSWIPRFCEAHMPADCAYKLVGNEPPRENPQQLAFHYRWIYLRHPATPLRQFAPQLQAPEAPG